MDVEENDVFVYDVIYVHWYGWLHFCYCLVRVNLEILNVDKNMDIICVRFLNVLF